MIFMQAPAARWGTEVTEGVVDGHPCRLYERRPRSMAELLVDAERWWDREFIVQGDRRLTGAQHFRAAMRVAARLRGLGVRPRENIVLLGGNSVEWLVAFWAAQLVGATAVLFNAWWSDDEIAAALALAAPVLIISDRVAAPFAEAAAPVLGMAEIRTIVDRDTTAPLLPERVAEEWPAMVIFSPGITGEAKGMVMSHRAVIANIQNLLVLTGRLPGELGEDHPGTVGLLTMPLFHLAGIQLALMNMLTGGKLVFLKGEFDAGGWGACM